MNSLLKVLSYNLNRQVDNVNIFEIGKAFHKDNRGVLLEKMELSALFYGKRSFRYDGEKDKMDFFQLKKLIQDILD